MVNVLGDSIKSEMQKFRMINTVFYFERQWVTWPKNSAILWHLFCKLSSYELWFWYFIEII